MFIFEICERTLSGEREKMKIVFGLVIVTGAVILVSCEQCTLNTDCKNTQCNPGLHIICQHPDDAGVIKDGGLCTCAQDNVPACASQDECLGDKAPDLTCRDERRHCYDGKCICSRFPDFG